MFICIGLHSFCITFCKIKALSTSIQNVQWPVYYSISQLTLLFIFVYLLELITTVPPIFIHSYNLWITIFFESYNVVSCGVSWGFHCRFVCLKLEQSMCNFFVNKIVLGWGFLSITSRFTLSLPFHQWPILLFIHLPSVLYNYYSWQHCWIR